MQTANETQTATLSWSKPLLWGGALFSMFFGAGNMIYSLWLGHLVDRHNYWFGVLGFILSAVIFPLIGLIGIWSQRGCAFSFLAPIPSRKLKVAVLLFILAVWGPFGAIPRAVLLTFKCLEPFTFGLPHQLGHLLLCALVAVLVTSPKKMVQLFGKWLTPALIGTAVTLFIAALGKSSELSPSSSSTTEMAMTGMQLGYQTMDGLAAIFFGKLLVEMFAQEQLPKKIYRRFFAITFTTALLLLAGVYMLLIESAARLTEELQVSSPLLLMIEMSRHALGPVLSLVVSLLMTGAALSTAIALALIFADFTHLNVLPRVPRQAIIWSLMALTYGVSLLGIEGIHSLSGPCLQVLYPTLLLLSLYLIFLHRPLSALRDDPHIVEEAPKE